MEDGYNIDELKSLKGSNVENGDSGSFPQFNEDVEFGQVLIELGKEFSSFEAFKKMCKDLNIHLGR